MKTNKNIKKTVVEESLMLKLSLSATETQYLTEKTDQNPWSPLSALNKSIANPYDTLPESELGGKKRKEDQTEVISDHVKITASLRLSFNTWLHPNGSEKVMSASDGRSYSQCSVLHVIPKMTRPHRSGLCYQRLASAELLLAKHLWERTHMTSAIFPISWQDLIPFPAPFPSWANNRVWKKRSAQGSGAFANEAVTPHHVPTMISCANRHITRVSHEKMLNLWSE